jgi:hypothetical protein
MSNNNTGFPPSRGCVCIDHSKCTSCYHPHGTAAAFEPKLLGVQPAR